MFEAAVEALFDEDPGRGTKAIWTAIEIYSVDQRRALLAIPSWRKPQQYDSE